ncbi:Imm21 family immunity protein [Streptomyces sp. NPDC058653]|uniref:Imm21 family immunity protein n=1 Tax=Streptomyces sp. NPDC058653 TaxID=3346576 RepID=UPI0036611244
MTSAGGPLILVAGSTCTQWGEAPRNYPDDEGDYGRGCEVEGYVGLIDVGTSEALVLGDMPARTTFLPEFNVLVREIAGDDEAELPDLVAGLLPKVDWESGPSWSVTEPVILFDAVYDSTGIKNEEHLDIDLTPGEYAIEAGRIETPGEYLVLVRLTRI